MSYFTKDTPEWFKQWAKNNQTSFGASSDFNSFSSQTTSGSSERLKKIYEEENNALKKQLAEKQALVEQKEAEIANKELLISKSKSKEKKRIYREELAELNSDREKYQKEYDDLELESTKKQALQEKAIKIAANNDYIKADLEGKRKINQQRMEDLKQQLQNFETLAAKNKGLTEEQEKAKDKAAHDLDRLNKLDLAFLEEKRKAQSKNVSLEEKLAIAKSNLSQRQEAQKESNATYAADVAAAKKLKGDAKKVAIAEAKERKKERDTKADAEYGKTTGATGIMAAFGDAAALGGLISIVPTILKGADALITNPWGTLLKGLITIVDAGFKAVQKGVEMYASLQDQYLAKINTRLDTGATYNKRTFDTLTNGFKGIVGSNGYISQKSIIENLGSLVDKGVAYNLEQRTILMTISDRMVSTFNMLDDTLLRLTKLQQADASISDLGNQSKLTQFLNNNFEDTSYMSEEYSTINSALTEAFSQMNVKDMTSYSYNVHKWLSALYALGMSGSGVEKIAEGLNYLSTGNVEAFNSDDSLRTLFAMASGGSYSDLLVNGVNATNVNTLLNNIVSYLANISTDTNQVTKNVKAGVFGGLSLSDIRAVSNLSVSDIANINASTSSWESTRSQVNSLLSNVEENTTTAMKLGNIVDNTLYNLGETIVKSDYYGKYVLGGLIGGTVGEWMQKGSGLLALFQSGAFSDAFSGFSKYKSGLSDILSSGYWNLTDAGLIKSRGEAYTGVGGVSTNFSTSSASYSNYNDSALNTSFINNATSVKAGQVTYSGSSGTIWDVTDIYAKLFEDKQAIRVILADVETTAQDNLAGSIYGAYEAKLNSIDDNITTTRTQLYSKLSDINARQGYYSIGL